MFRLILLEIFKILKIMRWQFCSLLIQSHLKNQYQPIVALSLVLGMGILTANF